MISNKCAIFYSITGNIILVCIEYIQGKLCELYYLNTIYFYTEYNFPLNTLIQISFDFGRYVFIEIHIPINIRILY